MNLVGATQPIKYSELKDRISKFNLKDSITQTNDGLEASPSQNEIGPIQDTGSKQESAVDLWQYLIQISVDQNEQADSVFKAKDPKTFI